MAKDYFSKEVCEQLAHELVTEQAELLKHEALVKKMKKQIVEGKKLLIKHLIKGKTFYIDGMKMTVKKIDFYEEPDSLMVYITFGLDINLLRYYTWMVDFSNPSSNTFFRESGLIVPDNFGTIMLEELAC